ncbi:hypothetical protein CPHO_03830 [Corynebacterium phocae]|uniref:Uncharacterized protein n=1 Tax=Corynebacterium phocae TaxID=161895 RepID=A0A1L7D225_9CORY|nr:DUF2786 domain-containing protein [Corynebacterium phocae]APT92158.1 hypothetical protein CPHO_03830 [Corynebacterium phocae]KAA8725944.1 DUF2786 domain-containing protein [Corynebacterium phocae]
MTFNRTNSHALDLLVTAARCGWGPKDLLHVLGPKAHAIIYRAAPRVPARITSEPLRHEWLMFPPPKDPAYNQNLVAGWIDTLHRLPRLRDSVVLDMPVDPNSQEAKIRRKIEALLSKAESTTFEKEAEALIARAQKMRQDYRVAATGGGTAAVVSRRVRISGPYIKHKATLLGAVCDANGVTCLLLHDSGITAIFGQSEDLDHVEDLFDSLQRQCAYYMEHSEGAEEARLSQQTASYRRSFQLSYASRVSELLHEANSSAEEEGGNLPVLIKRCDQAIRTRDRLFPHLSSLSLSANHGGGYSDGRAAAESSHFSGDSFGVGPAQKALSA